jgi:myo-inositol 2-dehydrogenase/D-chiro-inositol 1-dehydrogenase
MSQPLQIGIIGAGRIGRVHAKHLAYHVPRASLSVVADIDREAARDCADEFEVPRAVQDYREVLDDQNLDAVVICSSTDTHKQIIEEAAAAEKHIFCEKPIAFRLEDIDEALAAVDRAGVKFQVGFNRRFDPSFCRVRKAVEEGEVGQPHLLHLISRDPSPPSIDYIERSGGLFFDMTIHDFDMARFLVSSEVTEIYAEGAVRVDPEIGEVGDLDTAVVTIRFENGVIGTIDNSREAVYGYDQRTEVFGSKGRVQSGNVYPNTTVVSTEEHVQRDLPLHFFIERYVESYRAEMEAFVDAIIEDEPVPVDGEDGLISVLMSIAARKSYDENRPVKINEVKEEVLYYEE